MLVIRFARSTLGSKLDAAAQNFFYIIYKSVIAGKLPALQRLANQALFLLRHTVRHKSPISLPSLGTSIAQP